MSKCCVTSTTQLSVDPDPQEGENGKVRYQTVCPEMKTPEPYLPSPSNVTGSGFLSSCVRLLRLGCVAGSMGTVLVVVCLIVFRITTQFDNEWVESSILQTTLRVFHGQPLYLAPSVEYVPDNYPPLYFVIAAKLMSIFGSSIVVCRAFSLASTIVVGWTLWWMGGYSRDNRWLRWLPVTLFWAFYSVGGQSYDLARVDMLAHAFAVWGTVVLINAVNLRSTACAGLLFAAAILTKQNVVMVAFLLGIGLLFFDKRRALLFGFVSAGIPLIVFAILHMRSAGWSTFYLFRQPSMHPFGGADRWLRLVVNDLSYHGIVVTVGCIASAVILLRCNYKTLSTHGAENAPIQQANETYTSCADMRSIIQNEITSLILLLLALCGAVLMTILGRLKAGGFSNNLVPAWTFAMLALAWMLPRLRKYSVHANPGTMKSLEWATWSMTAVVLVSLTLGWRAVPLKLWGRPSARYAAIRSLQTELSNLQSRTNIWMPSHTVFSNISNPYAHLCPAGFLMDAPAFPAKSLFEADVARHLEQRTWDAIILDDWKGRFVSDRCTGLLRANYHETRWLTDHPEECTTLSGKRTYPQHIFIANGNRPDPAVRH